MKKRPDNTKDDVLYAFSVETNRDATTLEEYLQRYPQYRYELIDLSIELLTMSLQEEMPAEGEVRDSVTQSWETFQSMLSPSDPVSAVASAVNPLETLEKKSFRSLAETLDVNAFFLVKLRDKTIKLSTIPTRFIDAVANATGESVDTMRAVLDGAATVSSATSFKADGKPAAEQQISFDEAIENSHLSEQQIAALRAMKD